VRGLAWALTLLLAGCFTPDLGEGQVLCGANSACPTGYRCALDGRCYSNGHGPGGVDDGGGDLAGCVHATCGPQSCGTIGDNCGGTVDCGDNCAATSTTCGGGGTPHECGCPTLLVCGNRNCGTIPNGCGGVETCGGQCPSGQTCGGGNGGNKMPNVCAAGQACTPKVCMQDKDCGLISDGCSAVLNCGACPSNKTCGTDHMCH
jgi:hypothetical protein